MNSDNNIEYIIKNSKKILLITHINPDGDTLGSACGLASIVKTNFKKNCDILIDNFVETYSFLENLKSAKLYSDADKSLVYDLVITLDVASLDRMEQVKVLFDKAKTTINIDHHGTNPGFAQINIIEPEASSTGEIVVKIAGDYGWKITKEAADALYAAILTDTGSFRYSNTSADTFKIASKLLDCGTVPDEIAKKCYDSYPKNFVMFQNYCLNKAVFTDDDKIAYTCVFRKDIEKFKVGPDCTEGLTEKLRSIVSTETAFIAKELAPNLTKISLRSKNTDVSKICSLFGGGGHKFAAGCTIKASVKQAAEKILAELRKVL